ncbi:MAG: hypothetical protein RI996_46 [Candidatus Parcubacteria bacterium]|jgi:methyl-accepting chemotaxis protein
MIQKIKHTITIIGIIVLSSIVVLGYIATEYMTRKVEQDERSSLLLRSQIVAELLNRDALLKLHGSSTDMTLPEYKTLKTNLESVIRINEDARFVYIIKQENNQQFFVVDAEDMKSPDFSPSGQEYLDATEEDKQNYIQGIAFTKGPYVDAWGNWFTAYAPIVTPDGKILGNVGMDIAAEKVLLRIEIVRIATIMIFSLIFLSAFVIVLLSRERFDMISKK